MYVQLKPKASLEALQTMSKDPDHRMIELVIADPEKQILEKQVFLEDQLKVTTPNAFATEQGPGMSQTVHEMAPQIF